MCTKYNIEYIVSIILFILIIICEFSFSIAQAILVNKYYNARHNCYNIWPWILFFCMINIFICVFTMYLIIIQYYKNNNQQFLLFTNIGQIIISVTYIISQCLIFYSCDYYVIIKDQAQFIIIHMIMASIGSTILLIELAYFIIHFVIICKKLFRNHNTVNNIEIEMTDVLSIPYLTL
jgi:hypothetical protein